MNPNPDTIAWHQQEILAIHAQARALPPSVLWAPIEWQQRVNAHQQAIDRLRHVAAQPAHASRLTPHALSRKEALWSP